MASLLRMPEVAASAVEAILAGWPIPEDSAFAPGDVIATIETEKAVVDVLAEAPGVMLKALVTPGTEVLVGAPIAVIGEPGEIVQDFAELLAELGVQQAPATETPAEAVASLGMPESSALDSEPIPTRIFSSPLARRLAKESGLSLNQISGTGRGGRIVRRDVEVAAAQSQPRTVRGGEVRSAPGITAGSAAGYTQVPHSRMRRAIAARLTASVRDAPHFSIDGTARLDRLLKLRSRFNGAGSAHVSINDFVVLAAARAHVLVPAMNVIWTQDAVLSFDRVDVAVAVSTERGLITPVLRRVDQMSLLAVADASVDLISRARTGTLRQDELEGGALSVTNLGMFGTEKFTAIINPPQSAVLAVGAARQEPHVRNGKLRVATQMHVTLSVDHRPIDGAVAAQWMRVFLELLEEPVCLLV